MSDRPAIPRNLERTLFQEVGNRCPLCGNDDVATLIIHHITPYAETKSHRREHMLVLCANCHSKAERGEISAEKLREAKQEARKVVPFRPRRGFCPSAPPPQTVIGPGNIVAGGSIVVGGDITIRAPRSKGKPRPPVLPGTVATDPYRVGYLKYLAKRYLLFKEHDVGKDAMRYGAIYAIYQREIGFSIANTPLDQFDTACRYLHTRIENTRLGRIRRKRQKLYSTFEEFLQRGREPLPED